MRSPFVGDHGGMASAGTGPVAPESSGAGAADRDAQRRGRTRHRGEAACCGAAEGRRRCIGPASADETDRPRHLHVLVVCERSDRHAPAGGAGHVAQGAGRGRTGVRNALHRPVVVHASLGHDKRHPTAARPQADSDARSSLRAAHGGEIAVRRSCRPRSRLDGPAPTVPTLGDRVGVPVANLQGADRFALRGR
jgi:hypothetical protein